jgi:hypothetical protein
MCTNNLDIRNKFSRQNTSMAGKRKGRGTVDEPTSPEVEGETGERGGEQDTANWLEGERHTPKKK